MFLKHFSTILFGGLEVQDRMWLRFKKTMKHLLNVFEYVFCCTCNHSLTFADLIIVWS